jgi:hypothetical protein
MNKAIDKKETAMSKTAEYAYTLCLVARQIREKCADTIDADALERIAAALNARQGVAEALRPLDQALGLIEMAGEPQERRLAVDTLIDAARAALAAVEVKS